MKYKAVFWDFDGVWSKDYFYKSFSKDYPQVWEFIQTHVWGQDGEGRVDKWMRGELTMTDINKHISKGTGMDFDALTKKFLEDVSQMEIEMRHAPIVKALKKNGRSNREQRDWSTNLMRIRSIQRPNQLRPLRPHGESLRQEIIHFRSALFSDVKHAPV